MSNDIVYKNLENYDNRCYINTALQIFYYNVIKERSAIKEFIKPGSFYNEVFTELDSNIKLINTDKILKSIGVVKGKFGDVNDVVKNIIDNHIRPDKLQLFETFSSELHRYYLNNYKGNIIIKEGAPSLNPIIDVNDEIKTTKDLQNYIENMDSLIVPVIDEKSFNGLELGRFEAIHDDNNVKEKFEGESNNPKNLGKMIEYTKTKFLDPDYMFINLNNARREFGSRDIINYYDIEIPSILRKNNNEYVLSGYCVNLNNTHWIYAQCDKDGNESLVYNDSDRKENPELFNPSKNYRNTHACFLLYKKKSKPPQSPLKKEKQETVLDTMIPELLLTPIENVINVCSYRIDGLRKRKSKKASSRKRKSVKVSSRRKRKSVKASSKRKRKSVKASSKRKRKSVKASSRRKRKSIR
jgi:hypothetical protein